MVNRRFTPYIIAICIIAFVSGGYLVLTIYHNHVEFEAFIQESEALNLSLNAGDKHRSSSVGNLPSTNRHTGIGHSPVHTSIESFGKRDIWQMPTNGDQLIETIPLSREDMVMQQVQTPDGKIHEVEVLRGWEYQDGDAISRSELDPYAPVVSGIIDAVEVPVGVDPFDYAKQAEKIFRARTLGISVAELEKRIANGEDAALRLKEDKLNIARVYGISMQEVEHKLAAGEFYIPSPNEEIPPTQKPAMSDKPPVRVRFLPDESETGQPPMPKWARDYSVLLSVGQHERIDSLRNGPAAPVSDAVPVVESDSDGASKENPSLRSDMPREPSDLSQGVKPAPQDRADLQKQFAPEGIEVELEGSVPPDSLEGMLSLPDPEDIVKGIKPKLTPNTDETLSPTPQKRNSRKSR